MSVWGRAPGEIVETWPPRNPKKPAHPLRYTYMDGLAFTIGVRGRTRVGVSVLMRGRIRVGVRVLLSRLEKACWRFLLTLC
jgi:hypothetical protein